MLINTRSVQSPTHDYISCLLFDLGSTLWDRRDRRRDRSAEAEANRYTGELLRQQRFSERIAAGDDERIGATFRARFQETKHEYLRRQPVIAPDGPQLVQETLLQWGNEGVACSVAIMIFRALQVHITTLSSLFDNTIPTLAVLQSRGYRMGIVTNRLWGGSDFLDDLRQLGLLRYFDPRAIAISADVGIRKPHSRLYLQPCATLGIAPTETAMVGDSLCADVLGSQHLGMFAVWKPHPEQWKQIKEHQSQHKQSLNTFEVPAEEKQAHVDAGFLPDCSQERDEYLQRYLHGEVMPDMVIEHLADLLPTFVDAQAPFLRRK
jgi:HAD superfamily hydrolase (TIGR01549 family)